MKAQAQLQEVGKQQVGTRGAVPLLGVYLIVRDEEKVIDALLASLKDRDGNWAFDEYVFVDTGSTDRTREKIAAAFFGEGAREIWPRNNSIPDRRRESISAHERELALARDDAAADDLPTPSISVNLISFDWTDDFAAARNYAFSLGTAKWRLWLDADDELKLTLPKEQQNGDTAAQHLRKALLHTDKIGRANVVMLTYDYAPPLVAQDKYRVMRWADGWRWEGAIHEEIVPYPLHQRWLAHYAELAVVHQEARDPARSIARNTRICTKLHADAVERGDVVGAAKMAYYLGQYARFENDRAKATRFYVEAGESLGFTNMAAYAWAELAQLYVRDGFYHDAMRFAGNAIARCPEIPDGYAVLGVALARLSERDESNLLRAAKVFETLWALPQASFQATYDRAWIDGYAPICAVQVFLKLGELGKASAALARVPRELSMHPELSLFLTRAASDYYKAVGLARLHDFADYLIWNNEPVKALKVLRRFAPSNVEALPALSVMQRAITEKMRQLDSWPDYVCVYAAETNEVFDREGDALKPIQEQGRSKYTKRWAESLPKDGPPIELYVIGIHGGWIEEVVLEACPRIRMTACDVNPNANSAIQRLLAKFPGRVAFHKVERHHYDWTPPGRGGTYDVVFCFEVIEHVPEDDRLVVELLSLLKPGGELFLSTPIAEYWVAPLATQRHHWHQHVRAYQPDQLWELLWAYGFQGDIFATDRRVLHLCHLHLRPDAMDTSRLDRAELGMVPGPAWWDAPRVAIWIPHAPVPFDPQSTREGHVGGSEEAVIHLAPWLAQLGAKVEVYGRIPDREHKAHVVSSVLWRPLEEFDPARLTGAVLVWRSPKHAAWLKRQNPRLRVLNWLHDVSYGATPEDYASVDGTIVLSKFHAEAIEKYDGYAGPFLFAANGIEPADFEFDKESVRDPNLVIYSSAPNRGLDLLLEAWPVIREAVPDAKLEVYYGWDITRQMMAGNPQLRAELGPLLDGLTAQLAQLKDSGVTFKGGVSHDELHQAFARASVWAYPCHSFEEIFCITAIKAQAAGAWPVVLDKGAINEVVQYGTLLSLVTSVGEGENEHMLTEEEQRRELRWDLVNGVIRALRRGNGVKLTSAEIVAGWHHDSLSCEGDVKAHVERQRAQVRAKWTWENAAKTFMQHLAAPKLAVTIDARMAIPFDHESLHNPRGRNVGGSEEAVIVLAQTLAERGVDVTVHHRSPVASMGQVVRRVNGVTWVSDDLRSSVLRSVRGLNRHQPVIVLRDPQGATALKKAGYEHVILWLMDPAYEVLKTDWTVPDKIVCLTKAHATILDVGADHIIHNGLLLNELPPLSMQNDLGRHPEWVMWDVSPDRGLVHLLKMWPEVKATVPEAQLHIFYGLEECFARAEEDPVYGETFGINYVRGWLTDGGEVGGSGRFLPSSQLAAMGIYYHGSTPRSEYIAQHVRCGTWAYTNDKFSETFCMSLVRAMACGMTPVFTANGALPEVAGCVGAGYQAAPDDWDAFKIMLIDVMRSPQPFELRKQIADETRVIFSAEKMADRFIKLITALTEGNTHEA